MDMQDDNKHSNVLPDTLEEIQAFVDKGLEGEAVEVDLTERFNQIVDDLIKDGFEHRKKA